MRGEFHLTRAWVNWQNVVEYKHLCHWQAAHSSYKHQTPSHQRADNQATRCVDLNIKTAHNLKQTPSPAPSNHVLCIILETIQSATKYPLGHDILDPIHRLWLTWLNVACSLANWQPSQRVQHGVYQSPIMANHVNAPIWQSVHAPQKAHSIRYITNNAQYVRLFWHDAATQYGVAH